MYIRTFPLVCGGKDGEGEEAAAEREREVNEAEELLRLAADCGNPSAAQWLVGRAREKESEALEKTVENPHEQIKLEGEVDFPTMTISLPPGLTGYRRECPVQVHASLHPLP